MGFCQYAWIAEDDNQKTFWKQPQVIKLLEDTLRSKLGLDEPANPVSPVKPKKGWLRRIISGASGTEGKMFAQAGSGWQTPKSTIPTSSLSVTLEEMTFRDAHLEDRAERKRCQAVVITTYLSC